MKNALIILIDNATANELKIVHEAVKLNAKMWWHRMYNVWIVEGDSPKEWRDLIKECLDDTAASVLIFKLPEEEARKWAFLGKNAKDRCAWIHRNYG